MWYNLAISELRLSDLINYKGCAYTHVIKKSYAMISLAA